jgi:hypothetical protein
MNVKMMATRYDTQPMVLRGKSLIKNMNGLLVIPAM